jgi:hypothetical protein
MLLCTFLQILLPILFCILSTAAFAMAFNVNGVVIEMSADGNCFQHCANYYLKIDSESNITPQRKAVELFIRNNETLKIGEFTLKELIQLDLEDLAPSWVKAMPDDALAKFQWMDEQYQMHLNRISSPYLHSSGAMAVQWFGQVEIKVFARLQKCIVNVYAEVPGTAHCFTFTVTYGAVTALPDLGNHQPNPHTHHPA